MTLAAGHVDVLVIGAGAAGLAATRRLVEAGIDVGLLEARQRLGGRAHTVALEGFGSVDLGCGWLHSADINPWCGIATGLGFAIDRTLPPWQNEGGYLGLSQTQRREFRATASRFWERIAEDSGPDRAASELLEPGNRWNALIDATSTYINGAELDRVSTRDFARYRDTEINWRVAEGYGALISRYGAGLPVRLGCAVTRIDHGVSPIEVTTSLGLLRAGAVISALPSDVLAQGGVTFTPDLADKRQAAADLPLGNAEKVFLALEGAEAFPENARFHGTTDRAATGGYHLRPSGRPMIEAYFGGKLARELVLAGADAMAAFAMDEIAGVLGGTVRGRLRRLITSSWAADPFARGSYSHALPGRADARPVLAEPVDGRLFFAGEACSPNDFSTAHGAYFSGLAAADAYLSRH